MESPAKCSGGGNSSEIEAGPGSATPGCARPGGAAKLVTAPTRKAARKERPRGLNCVCVRFYCVMVTFTVIAGLATPPDDGVITMVDDLDPAPGPPLQPATSTNTIIAPAIPRRVRNRRASGSRKSRAIAIMIKSTCCSNTDGGIFMDCGGTRKAAAVMETFTVATGEACVRLAVGTEHDVISIPVPGTQVKSTDPAKPPEPVTSTGNGPVAPFTTLMDATETE